MLHDIQIIVLRTLTTCKRIVRKILVAEDCLVPVVALAIRHPSLAFARITRLSPSGQWLRFVITASQIIKLKSLSSTYSLLFHIPLADNTQPLPVGDICSARIWHIASWVPQPSEVSPI